MENNKLTPETVNDYIASFPTNVQTKLKQLRKAIKKSAPKAEELISYRMPAYKYHGQLVYFAGYKNHIGFYPMASAITTFKKAIEGYKNAKGSIQFPLDKPIPIKLIEDIIAFRMDENWRKMEHKKKKIK